MSGKRGPRASSLGPISGLVPEKLMWSRMIMRSPAWKSRLMPPAALVTISVLAPSAASTRTGKATCAAVYPS